MNKESLILLLQVLLLFYSCQYRKSNLDPKISQSADSKDWILKKLPPPCYRMFAISGELSIPNRNSDQLQLVLAIGDSIGLHQYQTSRPDTKIWANTFRALTSKSDSILHNFYWTKIEYRAYVLMGVKFQDEYIFRYKANTLIYYNTNRNLHFALMKQDWVGSFSTNDICSILILDEELFPMVGLKKSTRDKDEIIMERYLYSNNLVVLQVQTSLAKMPITTLADIQNIAAMKPNNCDTIQPQNGEIYVRIPFWFNEMLKHPF